MDIAVVPLLGCRIRVEERKWQLSISIRDNNLANGISNMATVTINHQ